MSVRPATVDDLQPLAALLADAHARSIYAETATFDEITAKQLCFRSMQRHGHTNYGGTLFLVSESHGQVRGFILAVVDLVYPVLKEHLVTDLLFIFANDADPRDAPEMIRQVIAWAERCPKVIQVLLGVTDAMGDWERVGGLYERLGFECCGGIWRKAMAHNQQSTEALGR